MKVKDIQVKRIDSRSANIFIRRCHYSGKVVPNSQLHFGCFIDSKLLGVMSFGPSINKKGTRLLIKNTDWNGFIELNRMAFSDSLPKNSESRCLSIALKLIKKHNPHIKWVVSFADGTQCGHGTMYQASNFILTNIVENTALRINPQTNKPMHIIQAHHKKISSKKFRSFPLLTGHQFRYVYILDKKIAPSDYNFKPIPYNYIKDNNIGMYKGKKLASIA
jgi:hypothetical protein